MSDFHSADLLARARELQDLDLEILRSKNSDYADAGDPFKNFKQCEYLAGIPTEQGMYVRMSDKFTRLGNLLTRGAAVQDERIEDTMSDLRNYLILMQVYLEQR